MTFWQQEIEASDDAEIGAAAFLGHTVPRFTWSRN
jgi:hypothetical protein